MANFVICCRQIMMLTPSKLPCFLLRFEVYTKSADNERAREKERERIVDN